MEGSRVLCSVLQLVFSRLVCSMESRGYFSLTKHGRLRAEIMGRDAPRRYLANSKCVRACGGTLRLPRSVLKSSPQGREN